MIKKTAVLLAGVFFPALVFAIQAPPRARGELSGRVSPERIPDLVAYRTGLRLIGSASQAQQHALLRRLLGGAGLSTGQLTRVARRATQLHNRLTLEEAAPDRSRSGARDATVLAMRQLERDIGRDGVQRLSAALKAVIKPDLDIAPVAAISGNGTRR